MPRKNTRAAAGSGSIRQRPDGRWEARYSVGYDVTTGKAIRKSVYGDTQAEVRKKLTEIARALDTGRYIDPDRITTSEWFDMWIENFCANAVKPLTLSSYKGIIKNHIKPKIGHIPLQGLKGIHIQALYNGMIKGGSSPKTVKNVAAILHKAFRVAQRQGLIFVNPCDAAELPRVERKDIKPLTDKEIPLFLSAIEENELRNAFALCLFAGLREGEALGLSWDSVDFERGRITVCQQLQKEKAKGGQYYIAKSTKSSKPRIVEPPPVAFDYLRAEKARQAANRLRAGSVWNNSNNLVFTKADGQNIAIPTFYKYFKRIAESIGRPDLRPHDLRHTAATVAIASGSDIKSVQDMLGHATASFTLSTYTHTTEQMMKDTASRVQSYYDGLKITKKA